MKFRLEIELGNATMRFGSDVADALAAVARELTYIALDFSRAKPGVWGEPIRDSNDNVVGKWEVA